MQNKKNLLSVGAFTAILIGVLAAFGVFNKPAQINESTKLKVVVTTTQLQDFVRNVGGDNLEVIAVYEPGTDPHEFEPAPSVVAAFETADLVVINGLGLENSLQKFIDKVPAEKLIVASNFITPLKESEETDPHIWFSAVNAQAIVTGISNKLMAADSANANVYRENWQAYLSKLVALDNEIRSAVATIPAENRKLVTNHDAFGYFIKEYGFEYVGAVIPSLSTEAEPSAQEISDLVQVIKNNKVKAIFAESSVNPKLSNNVAEEAGAKVVATLYGDSLGEAGSSGATYLEMMRYNTDTIVTNLK